MGEINGIGGISLSMFLGFGDDYWLEAELAGWLCRCSCCDRTGADVSVHLLL